MPSSVLKFLNGTVTGNYCISRTTVTFTDAEADGGTSLAEDIPDGGDVQTELVDREMKTALVRI